MHLCSNMKTPMFTAPYQAPDTAEDLAEDLAEDPAEGPVEEGSETSSWAILSKARSTKPYTLSVALRGWDTQVYRLYLVD